MVSAKVAIILAIDIIVTTICVDANIVVILTSMLAYVERCKVDDNEVDVALLMEVDDVVARVDFIVVRGG